MTAVLLDTHAWAWSLGGDERLSRTARGAMEAADAVLVSPISFFEVAQKVRLGKWPEMEPFAGKLAVLLGEQGGSIASLEPEICLSAGMMAWSHRDPFDRLLAATATHFKLPLVSADAVFDGIVRRVW
ncbi:PIN domain nuclease, a component of toxin-antitoxin system (PIN domain) [Tistlia consotensis]|uniref:PIN domain nuclease, a component of toxin-antitoxin system (PIN domain) n=1 Tax=Tistlia consotensis USBA 355 TaxID=560819 RepID=A0A1Y6BV32_9PROT|nr:type II toxin-antitoxin system VapC family toxin [Tistlia consotensis]SMF26881.1 PIN domain nuclease, a component of toxin-antitoxin system (PIN domain) [Tistlia consotensis USBA 355]SNR66775.1 PIN domain nuclease, a component of toxin-antitoxin system (PIN domain) [Tistlia consotensis]